jgi:hypothetical protein
VFGNLAYNLDFDGSDAIDDRPVAVDLNGRNEAGDLHGALPSDWGRLIFHGEGVIGFPYPITAQTVGESTDCLTKEP